ncbi:MAG: amidase family protein [Pseudomonadota bacterium]
MNDLMQKSAVETAALVRAGDISPLELMEETLRRIEAVNPALNAFVALNPEKSLEEARRKTEDLAAGRDIGPLAGLPLGVKDLEDAAGWPTTFGSVPFKDNIARVDSLQVARLKQAGAIVIGKTNTPEFGFTGFTKNLLFGTTRNPWDLEKTPGGSSGGAAAAVSGRLTALATGSDIGGSIRIPASYSGCFGLKPSFGRIPFGPGALISLGKAAVFGPLTRTVRDAALYLDLTAGYHPRDPDSLPPAGLSFETELDHFPRKLRIAYSPDLGYARVAREVADLCADAVRAFSDLGHEVELWTDGLTDVAAGWAVLVNMELYSWVHRDFQAMKGRMNRTLAAALEMAGSYTLADLITAQESRSLLNRELEGLFDRFDLLLTPTMPTTAFAAQGPPPAEIDGRPIPLLGAVAFTYPFNLSGHPAASVRAGLTSQGLPVGLQIVGPRHRDDLVLQASRAFEQARPWNDIWPELPS